MKSKLPANDANDLILAELEKLCASFGEWSKSLILGGGVALIVYDRCLARAFAQPVGTTDIDFLIPRHPVIAGGAAPLASILRKQGFKHRTKDLGAPPVESYFKEMNETEIEVEFLTDDRTRKKSESTPIAEAQIVAQPLSYLEMSLESAMIALLPKRTSILVVRPEAWVFHKGLTFPRRKAPAKKAKDLYGIWFVLTQLGEFSDQAIRELQSLQAKQPANWRKSFSENLRGWVEHASPREWAQLIAQDPLGRLTEASFRGLVERLGGQPP